MDSHSPSAFRKCVGRHSSFRLVGHDLTLVSLAEVQVGLVLQVGKIELAAEVQSGAQSVVTPPQGVQAEATIDQSPRRLGWHVSEPAIDGAADRLEEIPQMVARVVQPTDALRRLFEGRGSQRLADRALDQIAPWVGLGTHRHRRRQQQPQRSSPQQACSHGVSGSQDRASV